MSEPAVVDSSNAGAVFPKTRFVRSRRLVGSLWKTLDSETPLGKTSHERARALARDGKVSNLKITSGEASGVVEGLDRTLYITSISYPSPAIPRRASLITPTCSCPASAPYYDEGPFDWCKHAAALTYIVADLQER